MFRKSLISLLILISYSLSAQKFYLKPSFGYGIETFKKGFISESVSHLVYPDTIISTTSVKITNFSLAKGWNAGITFGYNINPNVSVEMGVLFVFGRPKTVDFSERYDFNNNPNQFVELSGKYTFKSNFLNLTPAILITKSMGSFNPYVKIGGILSYVFLKEENVEKAHTTLSGYFPFSTNKSVLRYKSSLAFGLLTSIGTECRIGDNFSVFLDIQNSVIYYTPKKAKLLNYYIDDKNEINNLNVNEKEFVYVDNYTEEVNINKPAKRIKNSYSLCNLSFNLGIKLNLGSAKNKKA
jgi:hypothetical protein